MYTIKSNDDNSVTVNNGADDYRIEAIGATGDEKWRLANTVAHDLIRLWQIRDGAAQCEKKLRQTKTGLDAVEQTLNAVKATLSVY